MKIKTIIVIAILLLTGISTASAGFFDFLKLGGGNSTINALEQWTASTTPFSAISPRTHGKGIYAPYSIATTTKVYATTFCINNASPNCITSWSSGNISTSPNSVLVSNSLGTSAVASTSPTVNYITATSTTATSTFAGGMSVAGTAGLTVLQNGNVGIGTTTPNWKLSVAGIGSFDDFVRASYFTATSTTATSTLTDLNFPINSNIFYGGQRFITASTTSAGNLTIGYQTPTNIDANGGFYNTGVGYQAMGNATSSGYNTALGYQALKGNATISNTGNNTAVGYQALLSNTTGYWNSAVGAYSLYQNSSGYFNASFGRTSLAGNTTGYYNSGFGTLSLYSNTTGIVNTAVGMQSLRGNTTGIGNVGLGYSTGYGDSVTPDQRSVIDTYMTFIGYQASRDASIASTTALTNGIAVGKNAKVAQSNAIVLGGTGTDAVNVGIGTTSASAKLYITNDYGSQTDLLNIATSTSATYATSTALVINAAGHQYASTTAPTLTSCGTGPTIDGTDQDGRVIPGATATGCTVTFAIPYTKIPHCIVRPETGSIVNVFSYTPSTTAITVTETGLTNFDYICRGR